MRNILLAFFLLFSLQGFSQVDYPKFDVDSTGQKVVIMTIQQAQALDNNTDLLILFEKMGDKLNDYDSVCVKVIGEKDGIIAAQNVQIADLKKQVNVKSEKISTLQAEIKEKADKITSLETEIKNKDKEINLHLGEVKRGKIAWGVGGGVIGFVVGFVIAVFAIH